LHPAVQLHLSNRDLLSIQIDWIGLQDVLGYAFIELVFASASYGSQTKAEDCAKKPAMSHNSRYPLSLFIDCREI
jgi:hypothetical protein